MKKEQKDKILKALTADRNDYTIECEKRIVAEQGKIVGSGYMLQRFLDILKTEVEFKESEEETVKAMEATNRIPKWTPVKERLPEKSGDFLVSVVNNKYGVVVVTEAYFAHKDEYDHLEESEWRVFGPNGTVIAWMPEPEPYKAESEDK